MVAEKKIVMIAGPNGAGKTTFAREFLPFEADCPDFINFLILPSADLAVARVTSRAAQGGHDVPEHIVRRRFDSGLRNFHYLYCALVNSWVLYDNSGSAPRLLDSGDNKQ